jgi:UDP-N-acetylmuramoyl-tripeptide--D-alanyl-D-alanine ligase
MRSFDAERIARLTGAELLRAGGTEGADPGPSGASIDTRTLAAGELFVGLPGSREDGGSRAAQALDMGAWGALVRPEHAGDLLAGDEGGVVLAHEDPLAALQQLAHGWRTELGAKGASVIAVTGSTGKTSTKDILVTLLRAHVPSSASPANLNTEIGLPLAILAAPETTRALVLEMAMRGPGQIAELTAIADPDVGVIVNVGPAHLELLGSLENIAAAKAELIGGMRPGCAIVVPAGEDLLAPHLREDLRTLTFGEGGDVSLSERTQDGDVSILHDGREIELRPSFAQAHNLRNLLAAVAVARVLGHTPSGSLEVEFSAMRGQRSTLPGDVLLIDDCYNANPMSMRAAIEDLAETTGSRRVAVLGDMLELGADGPRMHREQGAWARECGVELLVTVGPLAEQMIEPFGGEGLALPDAQTAAERLPALLNDGDVVLVKGSRGVGLERVVARLRQTQGDGAAVEPSQLAEGRR